MANEKLYLCDCMGSQTIDGEAIENATGLACSRVHTNLCGKEMAIAQKAIADGNAIIACQQERVLFEEIAEDMDADAPGFIDLRDRAGWTADKARPTAKMAAMIADAMLPQPPIKTVDVASAGTCLIIGDAKTAIPAAEKLSDTLSITVLLPPGEDPGLFDIRTFDVVRGTLASATGALGKFEVTIDGFQERNLGGRGDPGFSARTDNARSACDIILDLSGKTPLFSAHEKREGYLRAEPSDLQGQFKVLLEASQLVGTFEKPLYVRLEKSLCAHSRAQKTACTRCLDLCPTGAITPAGDHVVIDPMICAGCGACSAVCPSSAISYDAPPVGSTFKRIETLASTWRKSSKDTPRLLVHDENFGLEFIRLSARYGKGLPANVIPMQVAAIAAFGHAEMLAALGCGFGDVSVLLSPTTEADGLPYEVELANAIAKAQRARILEPRDPDAFEAEIWKAVAPIEQTGPILPMGTRRQITRLSAKALHKDADVIALPDKAPYGAIKIDKAACTLCLSCVSLCPSGALLENQEQPQIRFQEDACLQCGLCKNICPESAIELEPRLNLADSALAPQVLNEEEPFACVECGAPFGVRSTVMKITEKLAGKHAMFSNENAIRMIQMCDDCRVNAAYHQEDSPFAMGTVPKPRTTDDYH